MASVARRRPYRDRRHRHDQSEAAKRTGSTRWARPLRREAHRSGPRAQRAGNANGHARNQSAAASFNDRRDMEPVYKVPARPVTQTQIRSKRTRTVVQADIAADADGTPALRRLLNDGKS